MVDAAEFEAAIPARAPVVVFAYEHVDGPSALTVTVMEGFMTACEDGPPIGWVGTEGIWRDMATLADVAGAVRGAG